MVYLIRYPFPNGNPIDRIGGLLDSRTGSGRSPFVVGGGCVFGAVRDKLKWAMSDPERLRPGETRQTLTERAARHFARLAQSLRDQGHGPEEVAHFVNRLVFCMFAEDVGLLPNDMFTRMLRRARREPEKFADLARKLFGAISTGGEVGFEDVDWFNGGLFARHGPSPQARGRTPEPHDNPDLIAVENAGTHLLIEVKADREIDSINVTAKAKAARRWANYVNGSGQTPAQWKYLLLSETDIDQCKESWEALKLFGRE